MDLYRVGFKFLVEDSAGVRLEEFIPVFHRWIQTHAVDGMLIDVADYSHVPQGPGILLVAHEGNYAVDMARGRMGLQYLRKQPLPGTLAERLAAVCRTALQACQQLETAPELEARLRVRGDAFVFIVNDRLLAPNTEATMATLRPVLSGVLRTLYDGTECTLSREPDPRELFTVSAAAPHPVSTQTLLERLGA